MLKILSAIWAACIFFIFTQPLMAAATDYGIEGMRSQSYSVGIFAFMMIAMLVFVGVIALFYKHTDMSNVKTGEKVLMGMIVMGVVVAAIFAAVQLLDGYLF